MTPECECGYGMCRIQQLRLLSKVEQAGLLSLLEKNGITLTAIEKSGALSTAESLGLLSAAADKWVPAPSLVLPNPPVFAPSSPSPFFCVTQGSPIGSLCALFQNTHFSYYP